MKLHDVMRKVVGWGYGRQMSRGDEVTIAVQSGALPWRVKRSKKSEKAEVLLITGRRSGRWTIPKGWPIDGKSLAESAAQEAFEEAGIKGKVSPEPIGTFRHVKRNFLGRVEVDIHVHAMSVKRELDKWPERRERTRKWFRVEEAVTLIESEELRALIVRFVDGLLEETQSGK
jgi:8-oxo-dGTP pyrophosphatase MutT (NUDIX family)